MSDLLCPFSAPLVKNDFSCTSAQEIIRRGGAEIACKSSDTHAHCVAFYNQIRTSALHTMELEDDLLTLPHNVLVKIQYGGLLGLMKVVEDNQKSEKVDDVASLLTAAMEKFRDIESIPLSSIINTIVEYKMQRRREK